MQTSGDIFTARVHDEPLDVVKQVLATVVEWNTLDLVLRYRIERGADGAGVRGRDDSLGRQHYQVRVVNRHQRRQQLRLGVFEIIVEYVLDVLGSEFGHRVSKVVACGARTRACSKPT